MHEHILSISASKNEETAKQLSRDARDQGVFTFCFGNPEMKNSRITNKQMKEELDPLLSKFSENAEFSATTTEIQDESIFTAGVGVEPTQPKTQPVRKAAAPKTKDVEDQPAAEEKPADEEKVNICQTGIIRIFSKNTI